jgi:MFS transporter
MCAQLVDECVSQSPCQVTLHEVVGTDAATVVDHEQRGDLAFGESVVEIFQLRLRRTDITAGAIALRTQPHQVVVMDQFAELLLSAGPALVLALLMLVYIREPRRHHSGAEDAAPPPMLEVFRFIATQRSLLHLLIASMLAAMIPSAIVSWIASFLERVHGLDIKQAGLVVALTLGSFSSVGAVLGGWLSDRAAARMASGDGPRQRARVAALTIALSLPFGLLFLLSHSFLPALAGLAGWAVCVVFYHPSTPRAPRDAMTIRSHPADSAVSTSALRTEPESALRPFVSDPDEPLARALDRD